MSRAIEACSLVLLSALLVASSAAAQGPASRPATEPATTTQPTAKPSQLARSTGHHSRTRKAAATWSLKAKWGPAAESAM